MFVPLLFYKAGSCEAKFISSMLRLFPAFF